MSSPRIAEFQGSSQSQESSQLQGSPQLQDSIQAQGSIIQLIKANNDIFFILCHYLDPVSLFYLSLASKFFDLCLQDNNTIWKKNLSLFFPDKSLNKNQDNNNEPASRSYFKLFSQAMDGAVKHLSKDERLCFSLVRANNFGLIETKNLQFNIQLLKKYDLNKAVLWRLVKKNNNPKLNEYIFKQLCENTNQNKDSFIDPDLIEFGIILDQSSLEFKKLLEKFGVNGVLGSLTLLACSARHNSIHSAELLLEMGAETEKTVNECATPLYVAAEYGHLAMINLLLKYKANKSPVFKDGYTPLFIASQCGHLDVVKHLHHLGENIDSRCSLGSSPLYLAMHINKGEVVEYLLEQGASIAVRYKNQYSLLHVGIGNGSLEAVRVLLGYYKKNNYAVDEADDAKNTPLHYAVQKEIPNYLEIASLLLEHGADVNYQNAEGNTPLYQAAGFFGNEKMVELLLKAGANPLLTNNNNKTALEHEFLNGAHKIIAEHIRKYFSFINSNDLSLIKQHKIPFSTSFFTACEKNGIGLIDLIRQNNNPSLNQYIFDKLCENKHNSSNKDLLLYGVLLDQSSNFFKKLMLAENAIDTIIDGHTVYAIAIKHKSLHSFQLLMELTQAAFAETANLDLKNEPSEPSEPSESKDFESKNPNESNEFNEANQPRARFGH